MSDYFPGHALLALKQSTAQFHAAGNGDCYVALRRCRQDRIALAAEGALELCACEQAGEVAIAAGREHGEPVEHASERRPIDHLVAGAAIPAGNLHGRLVEWPGKAEAAARLTVGGNGEIDQVRSAEFAVDGAGGFDVVGDAEGQNARRDLARRVDEALAGEARPI